MLDRGKHLMGIWVVVWLATVALPSQAAEYKVTPRLVRALASGSDTIVAADGTVAIWVHFVDKGVSSRDKSAQMSEAEARLSAGAMARRMRMTQAPGEETLAAAVMEEDLAVAKTYVAQVAAIGAEFRRESRWLNATSWNATPAQISVISQLDCVASVDLLARFQRQRTRTGDVPIVDPDNASAEKAGRWSLNYGGSVEQAEMINVPPVHEQGLDGSGVVIGIIDTGYEFSHEALQHLDILDTWDFINNQPDVSDTFRDPEGQALHGTQALSVIGGFREGGVIGSAWGASYILAKTERIDEEIPLEEDAWIAALEWMESLGVDVVSTGIGYYLWYEYSDMDGLTAAITLAADMAAARGVCMVLSAGEQGNAVGLPPMLAPVDGRKVITVGSVTYNGVVATSSSRGPTYDGRIKPDVMAFGEGAVAANWYSDDLYPLVFGTSYANAQVAGVVALMLEKNPHLTPLQVRQALRETASRSLWPDNDYGWGIANAKKAVAYWGPHIEHTPVSDSENVSAVSIMAEITSRAGIDEENVLLSWRVNFQEWNRVSMDRLNGDLFVGEIDGLSGVSYVQYYIEASDLAGVTTSHPLQSTPQWHAFGMREDLFAPEMAHLNLGDQVAVSWPPQLRVQASDNMGLAAVNLYYTVNGGAEQGPFPLQGDAGDYVLDWPQSVEAMTPGDAVVYRLEAIDTAAASNTADLGPYAFQFKNEREQVLFVDDFNNSAAVVDKTVSSGREPQPKMSAELMANGDIASWLSDAGYVVTSMPSSLVNNGTFAAYDVVVVSSSIRPNAMSYLALRQEMMNHVEAGGKLLVEGGEVAYVSLVAPLYTEFAAKVLHLSGYLTEGGYQLHPTTGQDNHPMSQRPHILPTTLDLGLPPGFANYGLSDVVLPDADTELLYSTSYGDQTGGILLYDNDTGPDAGQVVFLPLSVVGFKPAVGRMLIENAMAYLTQRELPGRSAVTGTAVLSDGGDMSGTVVQTDALHSTLTGPDGSFSLTGLWGGSQHLTFSRTGYGTVTTTVELMDDQTLNLPEVILSPVILVDESATPMIPIPDNNATGVTSTIDIAVPGSLQSINIDGNIQHFSIGNLTVTLTSPQGSVITLHNKTGGTTDNLVGSWPDVLAVDGPGSLSDFTGENIQGTWTLTVADHNFGATGTLNSWGLHLAATELDLAPVLGSHKDAIQLLGNYPNPFNPRTVISFELPRPGDVNLAVFDLRGRMVRRLVQGNMAAGRHDVVWDGLDEGGHEPASGLYFYRLIGGNETQVRRMMLVR